MAPTIYTDQSALIDLYQASEADPAFKAKLLKEVASKSFQVVLSPWNWVETARTKDVQKASKLGAFMDELDPEWLLDRRHIERMEVEEAILSFVGVPCDQRSKIVSRHVLLSAMNGVAVTPERAPSSREFVEERINNPKLMAPLVRSHEQNSQALTHLRKALKSGKVTAAVREEGDRKLIEELLPKTTPNGLLIDQTTKNAYLDGASPKAFPSLAIECEIAEYSWQNQGRADWNSMVDKFHVISALPYVDFVVSDDRHFYLLLPIAQKTGFMKTKVIKLPDFCKKFLGLALQI